jgi:hypothetical protein
VYQANSVNNENEPMKGGMYVTSIASTVGGLMVVLLVVVFVYRKRPTKRSKDEQSKLIEILVETHPSMMMTFDSTKKYEDGCLVQNHNVETHQSVMMFDLTNKYEDGCLVQNHDVETHQSVMMTFDSTNKYEDGCLVQNHNVEINPIFEESQFETETHSLQYLEPDKLDDDDVVFELLELLVKEGHDSFEAIVEQVKGLPIYGRMLRLSELKRQELIVKLKNKNHVSDEVTNVISRLRRVNRASISKTPTVVTKLRAQMRWHTIVEKMCTRHV